LHKHGITVTTKRRRDGRRRRRRRRRGVKLPLVGDLVRTKLLRIERHRRVAH